MLDVSGAFSVIDSHTAGHPTRVILSGIPKLSGANVREQRDFFRDNLDTLRPQLLHEPRGHAATVGLVPVPSAVADYGAFFISSYIYLDMCGHGTIGYARTLAATGQISQTSTGDSFTLETPAGIVTVGLDWSNDGRLSGVRLRNVASRLAIEGLSIVVDGVGKLDIDIAYGGMWYAIADAAQLGLELRPDQVSRGLALGVAIKRAVNDELALRQTSSPSAVSSVLICRATGPRAGTHLVVLASNKFDRSPCGTGTSARLAQLFAKGSIGKDETYGASNILGLAFQGRIVATTEENGLVAIVPEITGTAHITAFSTIVVERTDPLAAGFLCS
ncbi:proline racemase family protein [soil metagenome]